MEKKGKEKKKSGGAIENTKHIEVTHEYFCFNDPDLLPLYLIAITDSIVDPHIRKERQIFVKSSILSALFLSYCIFEEKESEARKRN